MLNYTKIELSKKANELNFIRDTLEKVMRLVNVLNYLNSNPLTKEYLVLKGGTAINLTIFSLPRLSVDIDLDFSKNLCVDDMLKIRGKIGKDIKTYMSTQGYSINERSKTFYSLDSYVFSYVNSGGVKDNIKVEINYSLRAHLFDSEERNISFLPELKENKILTLNHIELFAAKINALIGRAAARDLYDVYNMIKLDIFKENEQDILRKSVVFYTAISQEEVSEQYDYSRIRLISQQKIKTDLRPVIHKTEHFDLENVKRTVENYLEKLLVLTENEKDFLTLFKQKIYRPELLFENEILNNIKEHPMAIWKTR